MHAANPTHMTAVQIQAEQFDPERYGAGTKQYVHLRFDSGLPESGIIPLQLVKGFEPGPTLLVFAAVHGDEYEGVQTVIELCRDVEPGHIRGTLLMVPVVNLWSYDGVNRVSPPDGRNLAREFPGDAAGSPTQRLAWHLDRSLIAKADFLLDLHSGGTHYEIPELVGYYLNESSDIGRRSREAAEAFGMRVQWGHPELAPGRSISAATDRGVPWLYTEAYGGRRVKAEEQANFRLGALRLMRHLGMLIDPEAWIGVPVPPVEYRLVGNGNYDETITAGVEGFFIPAVRLLDRVKSGDAIGAIYDWSGRELQPFHAYGDGIVIGLAGTPKAEPGSAIYTLTQLLE